MAVNFSGMCWTMAMPGTSAGRAVSTTSSACVPPVELPITTGLLTLSACSPDAIILDLMMPEFDGFQVLDALQRLPARRDVPVYIWTSLLLSDEEFATLARSARAIVIKGGGAMDDMLESVRRWRQPAAPVRKGGDL